MNRYLLDTVIVIDHLNGVHDATAWLLKHQSTSAVSVITRAEVLAGATEQTLSAIIDLLDTWTTLELKNVHADLAADLRRMHRWKLPDAFQAALATHDNLKLVTRNTKDFAPAKHSFVLVPYTLPLI